MSMNSNANVLCDCCNSKRVHYRSANLHVPTDGEQAMAVNASP